jgi:hypothetical protein
MRILQTTLVLEVIVLAALCFLASAAAAEVLAGFDEPSPGYDPCRDGRYSYGRAMSCDELLRKLDREEEERERRPRFGDPDRWGTDPCKDGRYSSGRPMTCAELREQLERRERRRHPGPYYRPYGALDEATRSLS